jgi:serine protease
MKKPLLSLLIFLFSFLLSGTSSAQKIYEWYQDGKVIFQLHPKSGLTIPSGKDSLVDFQNYRFLNSLVDEFGITKVYQKHPDSKEQNLRLTYEVEFSKHEKVDILTRKLSLNEFILYAEKKERHVMFLTPNDLGANSTTGQWGLYKIKAPQAWDISTGSTSVIVAVTDDAIQTTHPDLTGNMIAGRDVANNDNDPNPPAGTNSIGNHGTHVSGTVSSVTNNGTGVASIGWKVKIMPVKIGRDSDGALTAGYEGITWAYQNGAHVVNASWGGAGTSTYGQNVVNNAHNAGTLVIAAAGNDGVETKFYPAAYTNVIAVASTTTNDSKSSFSQYGTWIDISSPGSSIRSTTKNSSYGSMSGTSMASPLVAGLAGLMKSVNMNLTPAQIKSCLQSSADNIDAANSSFIGKLGAGRINAQAALQCVSASTVTLDAGVLEIISPIGTLCSGTFTPRVVIKNFGSTTITSVKLNYRIDNGTLTTITLTGSLASNATSTINLAAMTTTAGAHTFTAYTSDPNNGTDQNAGNNSLTSSFTVFSAGAPLPFTETFESSSFATNSWTIDNPDNGITWDIATIAGSSPGNKAARMRFFNYSTTGQRDAMISRPLDFTGYTAINLTFDHAYRRKNQNATDSIIISISTDCGATFTRVFSRGENGTGTFATATTNTTEFVPATGEWCTGTVGSDCFSINLSQFVGASSAVVKFESYNNFGNNLYIDNINITGTSGAQAPIADFSASSTTICAGTTVTFTDNSAPAATSWSWTFPGGNASSTTVQNPTVTYNTAGTYNVTLTATNSSGSNTSTKSGYIVVNALPAKPTIVQNGNNLEVSPVNPNASYQWYLNGTIITTGGSGPIITPSISGNYTVEITDDKSCENLSNPYSYTAPAPVADFSMSQTSICQGGTVEFFDQSSPAATSWSWTFNGGNPATSQDQNPSVVYGASGTYKVSFTATNSAGSTTNNTYTVTVYPNPAPPVIIQNGAVLECSVQASTYQWYLNGSPIANATAQTYTPVASGDYNVSITDANGCSAISGPNSFILTDISNNILNLGISVYPNPTTGLLNINVNTNVQDIEAINILGETISLISDNKTEGLVEFNLAGNAPGVYFIRLRTYEGKISVHKIVLK